MAGADRLGVDRGTSLGIANVELQFDSLRDNDRIEKGEDFRHEVPCGTKWSGVGFFLALVKAVSNIPD